MHLAACAVLLLFIHTVSVNIDLILDCRERDRRGSSFQVRSISPYANIDASIKGDGFFFFFFSFAKVVAELLL